MYPALNLLITLFPLLSGLVLPVAAGNYDFPMRNINVTLDWVQPAEHPPSEEMPKFTWPDMGAFKWNASEFIITSVIPPNMPHYLAFDAWNKVKVEKNDIRKLPRAKDTFEVAWGPATDRTVVECRININYDEQMKDSATNAKFYFHPTKEDWMGPCGRYDTQSWVALDCHKLNPAEGDGASSCDKSTWGHMGWDSKKEIFV